MTEALTPDRIVRLVVGLAFGLLLYASYRAAKRRDVAFTVHWAACAGILLYAATNP